MRLSLLNIDSIKLICDGYGRINTMDYSTWKTDPNPNVLVLGSFIHPTTRNNLMAGINLNYLTKRQVDTLRYYLPEILKNKNLYIRYWTGVRLLPDVFRSFYRYYNKDNITSKTGSTLRFLTPKELQQTGDVERAGKLQKRREQLQAAGKSKRIMVAQRPEIEPIIPRELEPELPPEEADATERAKEKVDKNLSKKLARNIDNKVKELIPPAKKEEPEEIEPEEDIDKKAKETVDDNLEQKLARNLDKSPKLLPKEPKIPEEPEEE